VSDRDVKDYLEDISEQILMIETFTRNIRSFERFQKDKMVVYACIRALEIMGEAVKNIPDEFRQQYPKIPWKKIAGIRDVLIHHYFGIDERVIWKTIRINIPEIKPIFKKLLREI
jgi:uncharacterized protein with HEPN domain